MTLVTYSKIIRLVKFWAHRALAKAKTTKLNVTPRLGLLRSFQLFKSAALLLDLYCFLVQTGELLVVRTCALEDMNSQCGTFKFENNTLKGCVLTCDYDGCNRVDLRRSTFALMLPLIFLNLNI